LSDEPLAAAAAPDPAAADEVAAGLGAGGLELPEPAATAAEAGVMVNPEVLPPDPPTPLIPMPPPAPVGAPGFDSPWARPASFTRPPEWDSSGYSPPPAIRLGGEPATAHAGLVFVPIGAPASVAPGAVASAAHATSATRPADARPSRFARVQLPTALTILLFIGGIAAGVIGFRLAAPTQTAALDPFPSLTRSAVEPEPAGAVARELAQNDVHGLAQLLDSTTLTDIQTQLQPLVTFDSVTFVGATSQNSDTLAGYVVKGRDQSGNLGLVGLVIRLRDGQVVAQ
jgi:hypothetical protein